MGARTANPSRFLRAIVALTYLVGYLLAFGHVAGERHAVCVEHDTHHHVDVDLDADVEDTTQTAQSLPRVDDDHCTLLQFFRSSAHGIVDSAPYAMRAVDDRPPAQTAQPYGQTHASTQLWRFAPKTSPPTHG